jgi:hypothetical protein
MFSETEFAEDLIFFVCLQPELNLPLLKAASSMPTIRLARYAKVSASTL